MEVSGSAEGETGAIKQWPEARREDISTASIDAAVTARLAPIHMLSAQHVDEKAVSNITHVPKDRRPVKRQTATIQVCFCCNHTNQSTSDKKEVKQTAPILVRFYSNHTNQSATDKKEARERRQTEKESK